MGLIHDNEAPPMVARIDKLIIGLMIEDSSFRWIRGELMDADHIVEILNRME